MKCMQWISLVVFFLIYGCSGVGSISTPTPQYFDSPIPETEETAPPASPAVIIDAFGREVEFSSPPQRIVVTGKALFMIADAIYIFPQAGERIVGLGNAGQGSNNFISIIDPNYDKKAVLENDAGAEQAAALNPDLVILKSYLADTLGQPFETLGIPVVYVDLETPEQYYRDLMILGQVFQQENRAKEIIEFYQGRVLDIAKAVADEPKPTVLVLNYSEKDGKVAFNVPPASWIQTQMASLAGGDPVWVGADIGKGWSQVTLEQIAAWDADSIFVISYFTDAKEVVTELKKDPLWQSLRATQNNHLYAFPRDLYSWDQPDTRWVLGLSWMAATLHPQQFPDWDSRLAMQEFYHTLYGLDAKFLEQHIYPLFNGELP